MTNTQISLRPPELIMQSARIGSLHPTRLSFVRSLIRRMSQENWIISQSVFNLSDKGYGTAIYQVDTPAGTVSLVCLSNELDDECRTDRVIADRWDTAYVLVAGVVDADCLTRLQKNAPLQEAGRFRIGDLVLSRANKSMRMFSHAVERLSAGIQPDLEQAVSVGYLMRTTAVYGNGKFGLSDLSHVFSGGIFHRPYEAEMLTVYLIRLFSFDLVEHVAERNNPGKAVPMTKETKRALGVGNATGLGMAPFLLGHPKLFNNWVLAREKALMRVRAEKSADVVAQGRFMEMLARVQLFSEQWNTSDKVQMEKIIIVRHELKNFLEDLQEDPKLLMVEYPWNQLLLKAQEHGSVEFQEMLISSMIEIYPNLVDTLEDGMDADERAFIDCSMTVHALKTLIEKSYDWALGKDYSAPEAQHYFWYRSEEKEEPRLGERLSECGANLETPIGIARDVSALYSELSALSIDVQSNMNITSFLISKPRFRGIVTRIQSLANYPYAEIRENLLSKSCQPIDLLRCKLSLFGASKYDPKSDRWTRVNFFQGAPIPEQLNDPAALDWAFPVFDVALTGG